MRGMLVFFSFFRAQNNSVKQLLHPLTLQAVQDKLQKHFEGKRRNLRENHNNALLCGCFFKHIIIASLRPATSMVGVSICPHITHRDLEISPNHHEAHVKFVL